MLNTSINKLQGNLSAWIIMEMNKLSPLYGGIYRKVN